MDGLLPFLSRPRIQYDSPWLWRRRCSRPLSLLFFSLICLHSASAAMPATAAIYCAQHRTSRKPLPLPAMSSSTPSLIFVFFFLLLFCSSCCSRVQAVQHAIETMEEEAALLAIKEQLQGEGGDAMTDWDPADAAAVAVVATKRPAYCSWTGVDCSADGYVTGLRLRGLHLRGSIPAEIASLRHIQTLDLSLNSISAPLPSSLFLHLPQLRRLDLSDNLITSPFTPPLASSLSLLEYLDLSNNSFYGSIPAQIGNMSSLTVLILSMNHFSGTLPPSVGRLHRLVVLSASDNQLTGPLPEEVGELASVEKMDLAGNQISSPLPRTLGHLSNLRMLSMANNLLNGSIPEELGNCSKLATLILSFNALTGRIPDSFANLAAIVAFSAERNRLSGSLPPWLGNWSMADNILLGSNRLTGTIIPAIGNCTSLTTLSLEDNSISGSVPSDICPSSGGSALQIVYLQGNLLSGSLTDAFRHCANLTELHLSDNQIVGTIPSYLSELPLITVELASNNLTGQIPAELWRSGSSLIGLDLSGNRLYGSLPPEIGAMAALQHLGLSSNQISGEMPAEIGNLVDLQVLLLDRNQLSGAVPAALFNSCIQLTTLDLGNNRLSGTIPAAIANLVNLECLILSHNQLTGTIPWSVGSVFLQTTIPSSSYVQHHGYFDLSYNSLSGSIPSTVGRCIILVELYLNSNRLTGTIPPELSLLRNLTDLDMSGNRLMGVIPAELGVGLLKLQGLNLAFNQLIGEVPAEIGSLKRLVRLNLAGNRLSGPIPAGALAQLVALQQLDLSRNQITGEIPATMAQMTGIIEIRLQENRLSGDIRSLFPSLADLDRDGGSWPWQELGFLNLSHNAFSGSIPAEIGIFMPGITSLDLHHNSFDGTIPSSMANLSQLLYLDLSQNLLRGHIPSELCVGLSDLHFFNVSANRLSGVVPPACKRFGATAISGNDNLCDHASNVDCADQRGGHVGDDAEKPEERTPSLYTALDAGAIAGITLGSAIAVLCLIVVLVRWRMMAAEQEPIKKNATMRRKLMMMITCRVGNSRRREAEEQMEEEEKELNRKILMNLQQHNMVLAATPVCGGGDGRLALLQELYRSRSPWHQQQQMQHKEEEPLSINMAMFERRPLLRLDIADVLRITNSFAAANIIGSGGFGTVYKGVLADGRAVAVKKLSSASGMQGNREFMAEMETLGKVKHKNVVELLGYGSSAEEKFLVYEYMEHGSLDRWLRRGAAPPLLWEARLKVAIAMAQGLAFLHHGIVPHIIHRDMKASNVLLDGKWEAKVADFGMARLISAYETHISTDIAGTFGYIAPEYGQSWKATSKGDVYSYGVILLELLTGREATGPEFKEADGGNLVGWVRLMIQQRNKVAEVIDGAANFHDSAAASIFDPAIFDSRSSSPPSSAASLLRLAVLCTSDSPHRRPTMLQVVKYLHGVARDGGEAEGGALPQPRAA